MTDLSSWLQLPQGNVSEQGWRRVVAQPGTVQADMSALAQISILTWTQREREREAERQRERERKTEKSSPALFPYKIKVFFLLNLDKVEPMTRVVK